MPSRVRDPDKFIILRAAAPNSQYRYCTKICEIPKSAKSMIQTIGRQKKAVTRFHLTAPKTRKGRKFSATTGPIRPKQPTPLPILRVRRSRLLRISKYLQELRSGGCLPLLTKSDNWLRHPGTESLTYLSCWERLRLTLSTDTVQKSAKSLNLLNPWSRQMGGKKNSHAKRVTVFHLGIN